MAAARGGTGRHTSLRHSGQPPDRPRMVVWLCRAGIYFSCGDIYRRGKESESQYSSTRGGRRSRQGACVRGVDPPPACNWGAPLDDGRRRGRRRRGRGRRWQAQVGAHILYGFRVCEIHGELFLTTRSRNGSWSRPSCCCCCRGGRQSTVATRPREVPLVVKNGLEEPSVSRLAGRRTGGHWRALAGTGGLALGRAEVEVDLPGLCAPVPVEP